MRADMESAQTHLWCCQHSCAIHPVCLQDLCGLRASPCCGCDQAALESVLVCGGGSAAEGAPQRVLRDLRLLAPPSVTPAPVVLPEYMPPTAPQCAAARAHATHLNRKPVTMVECGKRDLWTGLAYRQDWLGSSILCVACHAGLAHEHRGLRDESFVCH